MPLAPIVLKGGFYRARSLIADAQRCLNLYPEKNPEEAHSAYTHYLTPGLTKLTEAPEGQIKWRGLYMGTNDVLYGVVGNSFCTISKDWAIAYVGTLASTEEPVFMQDNGLELVIVDSTTKGYVYTFASKIFKQITDTAFLGANTVQYLDTFLIFNRPNTRQFYCTTSNRVLPLDPLYIASKTAYPDKLVTLAVMHREIWLLGKQTSEVWYNAGGATFPFQIVPGVFIEHGCVAVYSLAKHDLMLFWLSQDRDGQATVFMGSGYAAKRISTPAIAESISQYAVVSDAIGLLYKQKDHVFYMLTFPTANKTWVFDVSENEWHERAWIDNNGIEHRHRANCVAFAYGKNIVGDWENGKLYQLDPDNITDDGQPIVRRRGFPHITNNMLNIEYKYFAVDIESGNGSGSLYLRWSDSRGRFWGNAIKQEMGPIGVYHVRPRFNNLGVSPDKVFEVFWSDPIITALNQGYVDVGPAEN